MSDVSKTTDLIAYARKWIKLHRENEYQREAAKIMTSVVDALDAATRVPVQGEPSDPFEWAISNWHYEGEPGEEPSLAACHDALAKACDENNRIRYRVKGSDGPWLFYEEPEEPNDDREALLRRIESFDYDSDRVSDDLEQDIRALVALSRATVPDAATEIERERKLGAARQRFVFETGQHNERLLSERDAALAAIERVRAVVKSINFLAGLPPFDKGTEAMTAISADLLAALDGAPEPEEKR